MSAHRCRLHKRGSYMPPVRWYADTALAVGLRNAVPEQLRFFIAADDTPALREFEVRMGLQLRHWKEQTFPAAKSKQQPSRHGLAHLLL